MAGKYIEIDIPKSPSWLLFKSTLRCWMNKGPVSGGYFDLADDLIFQNVEEIEEPESKSLGESIVVGELNSIVLLG